MCWGYRLSSSSPGFLPDVQTYLQKLIAAVPVPQKTCKGGRRFAFPSFSAHCLRPDLRAGVGEKCTVPCFLSLPAVPERGGTGGGISDSPPPYKTANGCRCPYLQVVQNLPPRHLSQCLSGSLSKAIPTVARLYSSCFLGPRQKLTRRIKASLPQRGRRLISDATITGGDLLGFTSRFQSVAPFVMRS